MAANPNSDDFYKWAKDAGNKLRAFVLSYASGATAVFFLALAGKDIKEFSFREKALLITALTFYVVTAILCLFELNVDARRFFFIAKQLEQPESERDWRQNDAYKRTRLGLIYGSYATATLATIAVVGFLIMRIA
jgi:hypothetical protein